MAIHYPRLLVLNEESFTNFFRNTEDLITMRPVFIDKLTGIVIKDFTITTEETHEFMNQHGDLSTLTVSVNTEEYVGITTVKKLYDMMTTSPILIKDEEWCEGFVDDLRYSVKRGDFHYALEKVFNENDVHGWEPDCMEEVVIPALKNIREDYIALTKGLKELTDSPAFKVEFEVQSVRGTGDTDFKFYSYPMKDSKIYLELTLTDYQGEIGDTKEEFDEFLFERFGIEKGDPNNAKIVLINNK